MIWAIWTKGMLAVLCALALAGCGSAGKEQQGAGGKENLNREEPKTAGESDTDTNSASQNPDSTDGVSSKEEENGDPATHEELINEAAVTGSVTQFQDGMFLVASDNQNADGGQIAIGAAEGYEDAADSVTVRCGADCVFRIASLDINTGDIRYEDADREDVKESTDVAVLGERQASGEILARRVYIIRYQ